MPPAPPGNSGKSGKKATKAQSGVASSSKAGATSSTAEPVVEVNASETPVAPAQDGAEPPAVSPAPEEVLPPTSSGREIKPVSSLASQYLDATEIPASASERTGARSTSGKRPLSSIEKKRRNLGRATLAAMAIGSGIFAWNLGREWDSEKEKERLGRNVTIEEGMEGRWQRGQARFWDTLDVSLYCALHVFCADAFASTSTSQLGIHYCLNLSSRRIKSHIRSFSRLMTFSLILRGLESMAGGQPSDLVSTISSPTFPNSTKL